MLIFNFFFSLPPTNFYAYGSTKITGKRKKLTGSVGQTHAAITRAFNYKKRVKRNNESKHIH